MEQPSGAVVIKADWSRHSFARCDADVEADDTLVVTTVDDPQYVIQRFPPGTWRFTHVVGNDGHPIYGFTSRMEAERNRT